MPTIIKQIWSILTILILFVWVFENTNILKNKIPLWLKKSLRPIVIFFMQGNFVFMLRWTTPLIIWSILSVLVLLFWILQESTSLFDKLPAISKTGTKILVTISLIGFLVISFVQTM